MIYESRECGGHLNSPYPLGRRPVSPYSDHTRRSPVGPDNLIYPESLFSKPNIGKPDPEEIFRRPQVGNGGRIQ